MMLYLAGGLVFLEIEQVLRNSAASLLNHWLFQITKNAMTLEATGLIAFWTLTETRCKLHSSKLAAIRSAWKQNRPYPHSH